MNGRKILSGSIMKCKCHGCGFFLSIFTSGFWCTMHDHLKSVHMMDESHARAFIERRIGEQRKMERRKNG